MDSPKGGLNIGILLYLYAFLSAFLYTKLLKGVYSASKKFTTQEQRLSFWSRPLSTRAAKLFWQSCLPCMCKNSPSNKTSALQMRMRSDVLFYVTHWNIIMSLFLILSKWDDFNQYLKSIFGRVIWTVMPIEWLLILLYM